MKNTLLFLLIVAVAVLAFLLYQTKSAGKVEVTHRSQPKDGGQPIDTVPCPVRTGQNHKTCVIPISYLTDMAHGWDKDYAIELHHKDTVKWVGDSGEIIEVPDMPAVHCSDHSPGVGTGGESSLIGQISPKGNIVTAVVTDNPKNDSFCYKNTIYVTLNGIRTPIDPHYFGDGP
jgi:hypothetical protein